MSNTPYLKWAELLYHHIDHWKGVYEYDDQRLSVYKVCSPWTKHQISIMNLEYPKNSTGRYHAEVWYGGYKIKALSG